MAAATPSCVWAGDLLCEKARPVRVIEGELPELPVLLGMGNSPEGDIFSLESRERSPWDENLESEPTQSAARVRPTEWDVLLFVYRHGVCAISVKSAHIPQVMGCFSESSQHTKTEACGFSWYKGLRGGHAALGLGAFLS